MTAAPSLVWFRLDLRLADNPALVTACARGGPVIPVFVWSPEEEGDWPPGAASRWWLHQSLTSLARQLGATNSRLVIRRGPTMTALMQLAEETGADAVYWNRRYEPWAVQRDADLKKVFRGTGLTAESFNGSLLFEPWELATRTGGPFQVFTPFWKACLARPAPPIPQPAPNQLVAPEEWPAAVDLDDLGLEPTIDWAGGIRDAWEPGEPAAAGALHRFLGEVVHDYGTLRDIPGRPGTSRLSPHLHFGEIGPRQVWHAVHKALAGSRRDRDGVDTYLKEIGWREFAYSLLYHFPESAGRPLRDEFSAFPWREDATALRAWRRGRTGFPIVDAGMRELWATGWMHNRVRMIVGSFLVKDLLVSWVEGARWFWDTLVDADLANNTLGWQWVAGCGADAAPYFRVFNPVTQGEKVDYDGAYVRRWVPELAALPDDWLHHPWDAPADVRRSAGVELGRTYPLPIVDHAEARRRALAALGAIKS